MRPIRSLAEVVAVAVVLIGVSLATVWAADVKIGPADEYDPQIEVADFYIGGLPANGPYDIDNLYWPLEPGTTFVYEDEDGEEHNEVEVTSDTKTIHALGGDIICVVVEDKEWESEDGIWTDNTLTEVTQDWYAQDVNGNVWYFGEDSWQWENGAPVANEGSWEAYVDGALPGIIMLADPLTGDSYRQEFYEGEAEDLAKVLRLNASVETEEMGDYSDCMKTKEWTTLELGHNENKFYAPGVGLVLINELKGGTTRIELIDIQ